MVKEGVVTPAAPAGEATAAAATVVVKPTHVPKERMFFRALLTTNPNGASWFDQGTASFTAYDVPQHGEHKRLEYAPRNAANFSCNCLGSGSS